ncbi:MAG TPA: hypothetical protein PLO53_07485 [Candidatus Hydrogenedentes bacterium]|nr:hypothetical protein [Candidatus Hydrogenedentota bacterium]
MNRTLMLKVVNPLLAVSFLSQAGSGLFHGALSHEAFEVVHEGGGYLLIALALAHVLLNWPWIRANVMGYLKQEHSSGA